MTSPERIAAALGKGKSGSDEQKDHGLLPYPTDTRLTQESIP